MIDYEKLANLDYTVYDQVNALDEKISSSDIEIPRTHLSYSYEEDTPVVEALVCDIFDGTLKRNTTYILDSYRLEDVNQEEFEEIMYDMWIEIAEDFFDILSYDPTV